MKRRLLGLLAAMAVLGAVFAGFVAPAAGASPAGAADSSPDITITQTTQPSFFCLPSFLALNHQVMQTPTTFVVKVNAWIRPCNTVTAHAVIYQMPGNGVAWPQVLQQSQSFTINQKGVTTITFTKACKPVQFDVVTGPTPDVIAPWGAWHGWLLFPLSLNTSLQYFPGPDCVPGGECDDYTPTQVVATPSVVSPGSPVTVSGTGVPGDTVTATLKASPDVVLGSAVVDSFGQFSITGNVPGSVSWGFYDIVVSSEDCPTFSIVTLTVGPQVLSDNVAATSTGSSGGGGSGSGPLNARTVAGLVALLVGGFALVRVSSRRARITPARGR